MPAFIDMAGQRFERLTVIALHDFSPEAVCMVLASEVYQPEDYIRSVEEWGKLCAG